jgi:hypothetical protein
MTPHRIAPAGRSSSKLQQAFMTRRRGPCKSPDVNAQPFRSRSSIMSTGARVSSAGIADKHGGAGLRRYVKAILIWASAWTRAYANARAAATMYEHLSKLSDAELHRRGLSRATLARHVSMVFGSPSPQQRLEIAPPEGLKTETTTRHTHVIPGVALTTVIAALLGMRGPGHE